MSERVLAGGVFLAAALAHLVPDATQNLQGLGPELQHLQVPDADVALSVGQEIHQRGSPVFQLPTSAQQAFLRAEHIERSGPKAQAKEGFAYFLVVALAVHSFIEGMSLAAQEHLSSFVGVAIAITAHKGLVGFALGSNVQASCTNTTVHVGVAIFAVCSPVGMVVGTEATRCLTATGVGLLLAVASGPFLFCLVLDLILHALPLQGCAIVYLLPLFGCLQCPSSRSGGMPARQQSTASKCSRGHVLIKVCPFPCRRGWENGLSEGSQCGADPRDVHVVQYLPVRL